MNKIKLILILTLLITCVSLSYALDFSAEITPESRTIKIDEIVDFNLTITHQSNSSIFFDIVSDSNSWGVKPDSNFFPQGSKKTKLLLIDYTNTSGFYGVPIIVKPRNNTGIWKKILFIHLLGQNDYLQDYLPAVRTEVNLGKVNETNEPSNITLNLVNQNIKNLSRVDIKIRSNIFSKDITTTLLPLERKKLFFDLNLAPDTPPQKDSISTTTIVFDKTKPYQFITQMLDYEITYFKKQKISEETTWKYFILLKEITVQNVGNLPGLFSYQENVGFFTRLLTTPSKSAIYEKGFYKWEAYLQPEEMIRVSIAINYWPPTILVLIILLTVCCYFILRSPIILTKKIKIINAYNGMIKEVIVMIKLDNISKKKIKDIKIYDLLPQNAQVSKTTPLQTLAPLGPINLEKAKRLHWRIDHLPARASYLLAYQIMYSTPISKRILLDRAHGKFTLGKFRVKITRSNKIKMEV